MSEINFKNKSGWIMSVIVVLTIFSGVLLWKTIKTSKDSAYPIEIYRDNIELQYEGARADLVNEIDFVIRSVAPTTCMNGLEILRQCENYDIDLFFVLA